MEIIPIENELNAFKKHLDINERTIFSAKFGDGKTFFLNEFKKKYKDAYEFITIYPVNYQISDNKEIFEYIKRDILIQMVTNNMVQPSYEIPDSLIFQFFIMQNSDSFLENLLKIFPSLGVSEQTASLFLTAYKALNWSRKMTKKYEKYKNAIQSQDDNQIMEAFVESFTNKPGSPYEIDLITQIIIDNIQWFRKSTNKKVVLIIEDLDRMDPSHFFRILNIFSAHIDRIYQYQNISNQKEGETTFTGLLPNKFGFDNIITVFDYKATENIFHHFYGKDANYKGYINKFIDISPFSYSIKSLAYQYFFDYFIAYECKIIAYDKTRIYCPNTSNSTFSKIYDRIKDLSLRDLLSIIKSAQNITYKEIRWKNNTIILNSPLIRFIQTLKLIGYQENDIINLMMNTITDAERITCINTFLLYHLNYCQTIQYNRINYKLTSIKDDAKNIILYLTVERTNDKSSITISNDDIKNCIIKAFEYIMV